MMPTEQGFQNEFVEDSEVAETSCSLEQIRFWDNVRSVSCIFDPLNDVICVKTDHSRI